MADIVTEIAERLKNTIPGFTDEIAKDFEGWVRAEFGKERHYISRSGEEDQELGARNRAIIRDYKNGERVPFLARRYRLSRQHIWRIISGASLVR